MPEHPDTLSKYTDATTAVHILQSRRLRWSAPALYRDPFELNHRSTLSFDPQTLLTSVIRTACGMIFAREDPRGASPLAQVIRRWRDEERFASPEEAEEVLQELMARMVDQRQSELDEMMSDWRRYTRSLRICSFSAKADNLTAWQYFANSHKGAVLKFQCGENTSLTSPQPMQYVPARPEITNLKEQLNVVLHNETLRTQDFFADKFLCKQPAAKGEQEWRCFFNVDAAEAAKSTDESDWYSDKSFPAEELRAVYFGAYMPTEDKQRLLTVLKQKYPDTKVFQAETVAGKYEISFGRIQH
ncbi:hypothetical protein [Gilvimarinus chinensis]|uniref:hypothetical protein n=1 Tax=Gilvimarinus chinensis TaxID=396005 RepID=UPI00036D165A|nr:hypothetical protein [Gilvimarinus chinensis]